MSSLLLVGIAAAHSHHGLEDILRREGLLRPVGSHGARELAVCGLVNALDREMRRGRELRSGGMSIKVVAPLNGPSGSGCSVARSDLVLLWGICGGTRPAGEMAEQKARCECVQDIKSVQQGSKDAMVLQGRLGAVETASRAKLHKGCWRATTRWA